MRAVPMAKKALEAATKKRLQAGRTLLAGKGPTWAPRGATPAVERPGERQSMSATSAANSKVAFWFATYKSALQVSCSWNCL